ncbi:hypothetical protein TrLO_g5612 [Triparma laevis f. longispina]|uniref:Uncharacterized protein n=1 Tax=Triparma laevis f. longispina TaxID=1714387 RepID=A0A9W7F9Q4_9STRA|nr:hypothetical protein TrLO_g5612 [Triparma laevis f. longispina]
MQDGSDRILRNNNNKSQDPPENYKINLKPPNKQGRVEHDPHEYAFRMRRLTDSWLRMFDEYAVEVLEKKGWRIFDVQKLPEAGRRSKKERRIQAMKGMLGFRSSGTWREI